MLRRVFYRKKIGELGLMVKKDLARVRLSLVTSSKFSEFSIRVCKNEGNTKLTTIYEMDLVQWDLWNFGKDYYIRQDSDAGTGGPLAPPIFGKSVNPIPTGQGRLSPPITTGTPNLFHLPASLTGASVGMGTWGLGPPSFGSPIPTGGGQILPTNYYWHPQIFLPFGIPDFGTIFGVIFVDIILDDIVFVDNFKKSKIYKTSCDIIVV